MDNKEKERIMKENQRHNDDKFFSSSIESEYDNYLSVEEEIDEKEEEM